MAKIDAQKRLVVESASRTMDRLLDRVGELQTACAQAKPRDLKVEALPRVDEDTIFDDDEEDSGDEMYTFPLSKLT